MSDQVLGAVEIARLVGMSRITIHGWIKSGQLKAFQTPGRHYRVQQSDLIAFLRSRGLPAPEALLNNQTIPCLWIGPGDELLETLRSNLKERIGEGDALIKIIEDPFRALIQIGRALPKVALLAPSLDWQVADGVYKAIFAESPSTQILFLREIDDSHEIMNKNGKFNVDQCRLLKQKAWNVMEPAQGAGTFSPLNAGDIVLRLTGSAHNMRNKSASASRG